MYDNNMGYPTLEQQAEMMIEQKKMKDYLRMFNYLVDDCFDSCINSFTTKKLSEREINCAKNCAKKFMTINNVANESFSRENQALMDSQNSL
ncbi:Mitochondrial import inner membrane translocase subunit TIM9 [Smittium culicis]|uniref:Mitochondrial import inner membrane translocase subunit n=1 Tax=Smittium culicis TaxID=133412 RepID=A0A1R1WYM1_9FUNG|nr:Mitochondrial import inner membrane translocase subunit TIM9 [Smittium culicis]